MPLPPTLFTTSEDVLFFEQVGGFEIYAYKAELHGQKMYKAGAEGRGRTLDLWYPIDYTAEQLLAAATETAIGLLRTDLSDLEHFLEGVLNSE